MLLAVAGWWIGSGRLVAIPDTHGMTVQQASAAIAQVGLLAEPRPNYDDSVPVDDLLGTSPGSGQRVQPGSRVVLEVSAGRPTVPELNSTRSRSAVEQSLRDRTLVPVTGEAVFSDDVAQGDVVSLSPSPGTTVAVGAAVTMTMSRGPAPVAVPDVTGLSEVDARGALEHVGLRVGAVNREFVENTDAGKVGQTTPSAKTEVNRGASVDLTVSTAARVPDVHGMPLDEARKALEDAGLRVVVAPAETDGRVLAPNVIRTQPEAGQRIDAATQSVRLVPSNSIRVPLVLGDTVSSATEKLRDAGLAVSVRSGRNGVIYGQSPLPGKVVGPDTTVELDALG